MGRMESEFGQQQLVQILLLRVWTHRNKWESSLFKNVSVFWNTLYIVVDAGRRFVGLISEHLQ